MAAVRRFQVPDRPCQRPGCGRHIPAYKRRHARWCSRSCENKARRTAARLDVALEDYGGPGELLPEEHHSLAELHERAAPPQHWADIKAGHVDDDLLEFSDYHDVGVHEDQDDENGQSWNDAYRVEQAVQQIEGKYRELARPLLAQQKRNPGVRLPALVQLEAECEQTINAILRRHQRAQAFERAARLAPQRVATAHERQVEQAAARAFALDLGRGRFLGADPEPAGRATADIAIW
jgi:hypothetical protein